MTTTTDRKETELGMIPQEWEILRLKDLIDIKHGFAFKGGSITDEQNENILLTPGNIKIGGGFQYGKKFYNGEIPEDYILQKDDVIVTMTDLSKEGDTLGFPAKIPNNPNLKFLHNQRIGLVKFKSDKIKKDFLYWRLRNYDYQQSIIGSCTGTTVKHTSPDRIKNFSFALPPLPEQEAIADTLGSLDDKIELLREQNKTLETMGQAMFKSWFVDFEGQEFMVESEIGMIPKGWKVGKFGDIVGNLDSQRIPVSNMEREKRRGQYPYYGATSIMDYIDDYIFDGTYVLMGEDGSVVNNEGRPFTQYVRGKIWVNNHAHVLQGKNGFSTELIKIILDNIDIAPYVTGAVQPKISQGNMNSIPVIIPTIDVLNKINNNIQSLFEKIKESSDLILNLTEYRNNLLPKLMSGKLRF